MAAVLLFWNTNMAAVTSCENTLFFRVAFCLVIWLWKTAETETREQRNPTPS